MERLWCPVCRMVQNALVDTTESDAAEDKKSKKYLGYCCCVCHNTIKIEYTDIPDSKSKNNKFKVFASF